MRGGIRLVLCSAMVACSPTGPTVAFKDTSFRLLLDSAVDDEDPCMPSLDPTVQYVKSAQQLDGEGPFFVCPSVPFTATGDGARVYVSAFASATIMGNDTVSWVLAGAQAHASGARAVIVAEEQALVSVALQSSGIERCPTITWNDNWNAGCN